MHNSVDNVENFLPLGVDVDGDLLDRLVENRIGFHLLFDLLERVDDGVERFVMRRTRYIAA